LLGRWKFKIARALRATFVTSDSCTAETGDNPGLCKLRNGVVPRTNSSFKNRFSSPKPSSNVMGTVNAHRYQVHHVAFAPLLVQGFDLVVD